MISTSTDTSTQLVQLCQAEAVRVFNHHYCGVGDINTNFNNCCRNKNVELAFAKAIHNLVFLLRFEFAVHQTELEFLEDSIFKLLVFLSSSLRRKALRLFNEREDNIGLSPLFNLLLHQGIRLLLLRRAKQFGLNRLSARWQFIDFGNIEISMHGQRQRSGNRRCRHGQKLRRHTLRFQTCTLLYPKTMLFINDN